MILVATGTHHQPFDRLVAAADAVAAVMAEPVVLQRGCSTRPAPHCEVHDLLPPGAFEALVGRARVVVLHGGSSSFLQARALGHRPILVPRRPELGEHIDDHQLRFARSLGDAIVWAEPGALLEAVQHGTRVLPGADPGARSRAFCEAFGRLVDALCAGDGSISGSISGSRDPGGRR
ncbi:MAG TPA: hypothetical protein ENK18_06555 [Deltaproteobacteria bacterium]|nr:hypothetical protein [Deltaproteobacteria bacterium]